MSSLYPILDNKPIDQWKVTELKEELRRRKLTTKGLKEDLVKRLDEAIRNERDHKEEIANGSIPKAGSEAGLNEPICSQDSEAALNLHGDGNIENCNDGKELNTNQVSNDGLSMTNESQNLCDNPPAVDIRGNVTEEEQVKIISEDPISTTRSDGAFEEETVAVSADNAIESEQSQDMQNFTKNDEQNNDVSEMKNENTVPPVAEALPGAMDLENQVSEVDPSLGLQVECEYVSTDSMSINEKNELKDNLNANNFHLELEVVNPEKMQTSSTDTPPTVGDDLHPLDDQERGKNLDSTPDDKNASDVDNNTKTGDTDQASEKLNLERSSGDDSLEEDALESKQNDSYHNLVELEKTHEPINVVVLKEDQVCDVMVVDNIEEAVIEKLKPPILNEKRKLEENDAVPINETPKRQRRWSTETIKIPEVSANLTPSTTPRDSMKLPSGRVFNRSDSGLSSDSPKERVVPPSQKTATTSLRIDRFVRPFTLKAIQELLAKTGTVCSFWMDHIKTHCYVTYSSVDEAVATRNAVYNLQWPPNGGKLLIADFVSPEEVKGRVDIPPSSVPAIPSPKAPSRTQPPPPSLSTHKQQPKLAPPPSLPPPPPISESKKESLPSRERLPPPPPPSKKTEPPVVTLDDLFKKTKTTPRIYYLPLSEEQVAEKLAARGRSTKT